MPQLANLGGVIIKMYFLQGEHNPPHVHAISGGNACAIAIKTGELLDGTLPAKELRTATEWVSQNQEKLIKLWETQDFSQFKQAK